jgi:hypothetical protein
VEKRHFCIKIAVFRITIGSLFDIKKTYLFIYNDKWRLTYPQRINRLTYLWVSESINSLWVSESINSLWVSESINSLWVSLQSKYVN